MRRRGAKMLGKPKAARRVRRPWWLDEAERRALLRLRERSGSAPPPVSPEPAPAATIPAAEALPAPAPAPRLVLAALRHVLAANNGQHHEHDKAAAASILAALRRLGGDALEGEPGGAATMAKVSSYERDCSGLSLPKWWTRADADERARTLIEVAGDAEVAHLLVDGGEADAAPADGLPTVGSTLSRYRERLGPKKRKRTEVEKGESDDDRRSAAPGEPAAATAA